MNVITIEKDQLDIGMQDVLSVILEESASTLTQGRPGPGSEGYYQTRF